MSNFWIAPLLHSVSNTVPANGEICMPKEMQVQASQSSALPPTPFQLSIQMTISNKRHINIKSNLGRQSTYFGTEQSHTTAQFNQ